MPARHPSEPRLSDEAVRAAALRLARPDGHGGMVVERAAILAEGTPSAAIEAWIIGHGGAPEAPTRTARASGTYGLRAESPLADSRSPQRYLLPSGAFDPRPGSVAAPDGEGAGRG